MRFFISLGFSGIPEIFIALEEYFGIFRIFGIFQRENHFLKCQRSLKFLKSFLVSVELFGYFFDFWDLVDIYSGNCFSYFNCC